MAAALTGVLLLVVAVGVGLLVGRAGQGYRPGPAPRDEPVAAPVETGGAPVGAPTTEPATAPAGSAAAAIQCWDGSSASSRSGCTRPTGPTGLAWVFPSFDPTSSSCYDALARDPSLLRPTMWECTASVGGTEVLLRYSELGDVTTGRDYYEDQYSDGSRSTVDEAGRPSRYVWRQAQVNADGVYKLSSMYVDYPYSISIEAPDAGSRDAALSSLLTFRRPQDIRGAG